MSHPTTPDPNPDQQREPLRVVGDCRVCGELVEYIDVTDPYWRHVGPIPDPPHAAAPTNRRTAR